MWAVPGVKRAVRLRLDLEFSPALGSGHWKGKGLRVSPQLRAPSAPSGGWSQGSRWKGGPARGAEPLRVGPRVRCGPDPVPLPPTPQLKATGARASVRANQNLFPVRTLKIGRWAAGIGGIMRPQREGRGGRGGGGRGAA